LNFRVTVTVSLHPLDPDITLSPEAWFVYGKARWDADIRVKVCATREDSGGFALRRKQCRAIHLSVIINSQGNCAGARFVVLDAPRLLQIVQAGALTSTSFEGLHHWKFPKAGAVMSGINVKESNETVWS
jgi:hypothetical protein